MIIYITRLFFFFSIFSFILQAYAAGVQNEKSEKVQVEALTNTYWNQVGEVEVGVVQNRVYTKKRKIEIEALSGFLINNAFVNSYPLGLNAGYHINELFSVHMNYTYVFNSNSQAYFDLNNQINTMLDAQNETYSVHPAVNRVNHFIGIEGRASLMYGKISLLGKSIQYFDAFLTLGLGSIVNQTNTEYGVTVGFGQQFHILKYFSFLIEYKALMYNNNVQQYSKQIIIDTSRQFNYTHNVVFGLCFFVGPLY